MKFRNMTLPVRAGIGFGVGLASALIAAYLIAGLALGAHATGRVSGVDWMAVAPDLLRAPATLQTRVALIAGGAGAGILALALYGALCGPGAAYGDARFATPAMMKREGYAARLGAPDETDHEIILAKVGPPAARRALFVKTGETPHALVIAPTESGKTAGFVIPNLLHFNGSVVALDIKGELFDETARRRIAVGDRVVNFRPDRPSESHGWNPLSEAAKIEDPDARWVEIADIANALVTPQNASMEGFADSGKALFAAVAMVMIDRGRTAVGDALSFLTTAGQDDFAALAEEAAYSRTAAELISAAQQEPKILASYTSVLMNAGLGLWRDPMVDQVTRRSDFDFADLRRRPATIYFMRRRNARPTMRR